MFERLSNGWDLARQSFRVLMLDKELLVFPLLSGIACILVLASFAIPLWNSPLANVLDEDAQAPNQWLAYVVMFAYYTVNYFVIVYFNAALVACAIIRFKGGNPTLGDGFGAANARLPQILAWALVSATVGMILRIIESRSEAVGKIAAGLIGMAWSIGTYFVVPVLVVEKVGPLDAMKRSAAVLRKAWGESLVANFGIGLIVFLLFLVALVPAVLGFMVGNTTAIVVGIVVTLLAWIVIGLISAAANTIIIAAVYLYAADGVVPEQFDKDQLSHAFGMR